jgi:hypothetical protein
MVMSFCYWVLRRLLELIVLHGRREAALCDMRRHIRRPDRHSPDCTADRHHQLSWPVVHI